MLDRVKEAVEKCIARFQSNPFDLLYETDLQAFLFTELRDVVTHKVSVQRVLDPGEDRFAQVIETSVVHCEYPGQDSALRKVGLTGKFDVVVLDPSVTLSAQDYRARYGAAPGNELVWCQPITFAVELKVCTIGYALGNGIRGIRKDLEKLRKYERHYNEYYKPKTGRAFTGLALLFVQSSASNDKLGSKASVAHWTGERGVHGLIVTPRGQYGWNEHATSELAST